MNGKAALVLALIAAGVGGLTSPALAQEEGYPFSFANFGLEFWGGFAKIDPDEFNSVARYEEKYLNFFYPLLFQTAYGSEAVVTRTGDSMIGPLEKVRPWGLRLTYRASQTLTLSLGFERVLAERASVADVLVAAPGGVGAEYHLPDFLISASGWIPMLQAHFGWELPGPFRFELFIGGGPVFTKIRSRLERREVFIDVLGRRYEETLSYDMSGRATGICGEIGARLRVRPSKFFTLFIESAYSFRHTAELRGGGNSRLEILHPGAEPVVTLKNWEDKLWCMVPYETYASWGSLIGLKAANDYVFNALSWGGPGTFYLDISGFQVNIGISLGL